MFFTTAPETFSFRRGIFLQHISSHFSPFSATGYARKRNRVRKSM